MHRLWIGAACALAGAFGQSAPSGADASDSTTRFPGLGFRGFVTAGYHRASASPSGIAGQKSSFSAGQLDLFLTSQLSPKLSVLVETLIEANQHNEFVVDPERVLLQYRHNDWFNLDIGKYHTGIGYYNTAYHHGTWFQTAATRPFLFQFEDEGGILPAHNIGLSATGRVPSGTLGLGYVVQVGNGRAHQGDGEAVQNAFDETESKAVSVGVISRPRRLAGLELGFTRYRDRFRLHDEGPVGQTILAGYVVYRAARTEWLTEAVQMRHRRQTGQTTSVPGFYSQFSRRCGAAFRPYVRYEFLNAASDPVAKLVTGYSGRRRSAVGGLRYDLAEFVALKFEFNRTGFQDRRANSHALVQLDFIF